MRFHEILSEKAPPGKKAKRFIKKATPDFKKRYGDAWKEVLYATAWKVFGESYDSPEKHVQQINEGRVEMVDADGMDTKVLIDPSAEMVKNLALNAIRRNGGNLRLRGICPNDKILYLWDAWDATHGDIGEAMGIIDQRYSEATEFEVSGLTVEPTKLGWSDLWDNRYIENVQAGARQAIEYKNGLVESLTKSQDLIPMDGQETARRYGLRQITQAYRFDVGDKEFAVYFDECGGDPNDLNVGFGFFKTTFNGKKFTHDVTDHRIPFSVLSSVLEAISTFLITKNPPTISFRGNSPRHRQFYLKLVSKLESRLPPGYFIAFHTYDDRLYISRDRTILKSSRVKPFSQYGMINESDDYDIRYDRFFWKANRFVYTVRSGDHANAVQLFPEKFGLTEEEVERYPINPEGVTHKDVANANKLIELALSKGWTRCNTYRGMLMIHAPSEDLAIRAFRSLYKENAENIYEIVVEYGPNPEMPIRAFTTDDYETIRKFNTDPKAYLSGGKR